MALEVREISYRSTATGGITSASLPEIQQSIQTKLNCLSEYQRMKVVALVAGLLAGAYYIDSTYFHGRHFRALSAVAYQITVHFGLR